MLPQRHADVVHVRLQHLRVVLLQPDQPFQPPDRRLPVAALQLGQNLPQGLPRFRERLHRVRGGVELLRFGRPLRERPGEGALRWLLLLLLRRFLLRNGDGFDLALDGDVHGTRQRGVGDVDGGLVDGAVNRGGREAVVDDRGGFQGPGRPDGLLQVRLGLGELPVGPEAGRFEVDVVQAVRGVRALAVLLRGEVVRFLGLLDDEAGFFHFFDHGDVFSCLFGGIDPDEALVFEFWWCFWLWGVRDGFFGLAVAGIGKGWFGGRCEVTG